MSSVQLAIKPPCIKLPRSQVEIKGFELYSFLTAFGYYILNKNAMHPS